MSLTDLLNCRRSVRHYDETPVDADTVRRCLQTAQQAVVFVTRQDLHRRRAQALSEFERGNAV